jgi:DNA-binding MarR family transcriptional regulator
MIATRARRNADRLAPPVRGQRRHNRHEQSSVRYESIGVRWRHRGKEEEGLMIFADANPRLVRHAWGRQPQQSEVPLNRNRRAADRAAAELLEQLTRGVHGTAVLGGLHIAQWAALRYFARANRTACTVTAFAAARGTTHGTATQTVAALVRKGCLARSPMPDDRRTVQLDITSEGRLLLKDDPLNALADAIGKMDAKSREALVDGLVALHRTLQARESGD